METSSQVQVQAQHMKVEWFLQSSCLHLLQARLLSKYPRVTLPCAHCHRLPVASCLVVKSQRRLWFRFWLIIGGWHQIYNFNYLSTSSVRCNVASWWSRQWHVRLSFAVIIGWNSDKLTPICHLFVLVIVQFETSSTYYEEDFIHKSLQTIIFLILPTHK